VRAARAFVFVLSGLALLAGIAPVLRAQISAEEQRKRELFLRARETIAPEPVATPRSEPVRPKPRPRPTEPPASTVEKPPQPLVLPPPKPAATPRQTPRPAPTPKPKTAPKPEPPPLVLPPPPPEKKPRSTPPPATKQDEKPDEIKLPPPRGQQPAPAAPIVVEKSGLAEDEGLAPPPKPERRGLFGWGGTRYRYLSRGVRDAIDRAPVKRGRWQYIIVHNSGTRQGNARIFANYHKNVRKMKNGLAYHFVIGNGTSSGDGEIEIGPRWTRQINGGHVASDYLNNIAIGICFVGDYNRDVPTRAQLGALEELIAYLRKRVGRSKGRVVIVKAHREINPKPTDCPGNRFPYRWLRRTF
jgi:hypothetical protein